MEMNNNYYGQQMSMGMMNQPYAQAGYYDPNMYAYNAYGYNNIPTPANQNALTAEEIQALKSAKPTNTINLTIDRIDLLKSMCTHKDNGRDVVVQIMDGSGDVYCPICQRRWNPDLMTEEEVAEIINKLVSQMQNAKWLGDLPADLARELFQMLPLLEKYPAIHKYAVDTFNKYYSARGIYNVQDTSVYAMYNSLSNNTPPVNPYGMPQYQQAYYPQQQPNQMGYMPGMVQNPATNPMQQQMMPNYGGVNPMAPNQQFVNQANMMMGGTVQQQPVYGQAQYAPQQQVQQQQNQQTQQQNQQGQQQPQANQGQQPDVVKPTKITL